MSFPGTNKYFVTSAKLCNGVATKPSDDSIYVTCDFNDGINRIYDYAPNGTV